MSRLLGAMSDRLLGAVLKEQSAGACVPEHGSPCKCLNGWQYIFDCNGICRWDDGRC
ncbi:hypothetical protein GCM10023196_074730 [Actinoallomurus vinaceus]|uniref:Uncharacterized protein n=1 Tax=Actinoallomurus vinaceus TaxID=1080074 RepID=A0ABP8UNG4_9ACTN